MRIIDQQQDMLTLTEQLVRIESKIESKEKQLQKIINDQSKIIQNTDAFFAQESQKKTSSPPQAEANSNEKMSMEAVPSVTATALDNRSAIVSSSATEMSTTAVTATLTTSAPIPLAQSTHPIQQLSAESEKNTYSAAYLAAKAGRYDEAIRLFNLLLQNNPQSEYSDQALFWLGSSQNNLGQHQAAIETFKRLIEIYPNSQKHTEAYLSLANIYAKTDQKALEKNILTILIEQHPDSEQAAQAKLLLQ
ncbi:MAG: tetratricopeptide repeat protein [Zetaproteobacteria bacterium]|nr:tetratricopeptide repeat protein [Zetaproteobacteria bacterium]